MTMLTACQSNYHTQVGIPLSEAVLSSTDRRQKKKAFFFEHARMTQTFCKWKRGDMKVRILISCGNTIQTKACVSSFVLFCAILAPN